MRYVLNLISRFLHRPATGKTVIPPPGRKMSKQEAQDYVFKEYHETLRLLAEN